MASLLQKGAKPIIDSRVSSTMFGENSIDVVLYEL